MWEYPSQHYEGFGGTLQGDPNYAGATPSWVIWQVLDRYTKPGDRVLDPMCGSGTTLDVCADMGRLGRGFDLAPSRSDVEPGDARSLPLDDACCDLVFVDPPYSTHMTYSDHPDCIGRLDAGGPDAGRAYYASMATVLDEIARVLRLGGVAALYVSDSWRKAGGESGRARGEFLPIGFELFLLMRARFEPLDIISVVRRNAKLSKQNWHDAAAEQNSFLRGFNYLFLARKRERPARRSGKVRAER